MIKIRKWLFLWQFYLCLLARLRMYLFQLIITALMETLLKVFRKLNRSLAKIAQVFIQFPVFGVFVDENTLRAFVFSIICDVTADCP